MAIDPSIAMGYRGLGELPNPMNQLAQVSQIQQSMRQGQMAEMQYKKALDTEAKLSKYYASIAENGGPKTAKEAEQLMLLSGDSGIQNMGAQTQMLRLQNEQELERFRGAQFPAGGAPAAAAPMEAPVNMMPGAVAAPARVNNLGGRTVDDMRAERDRMELIPGKLAANRVKTLTADIALASKEPSYQNVPGVGLVNPRDMSVVMPSVESTDPVIKQYNLAVSQGFKGSILDYKEKIAKAGRAQAQPPAPSIQTIADPTDPTKAIVIDTRTYRPGGGINSLGVFGNAPPAKTTETIREEELKTAYNTNRILNSAVQINNVLKKTPSASRPGGLEASAMAIFGNAGVANLSRSEDRQIVAAAQSDIIDSLLYLATGAAYNKEQLAQQRQSYLPAFTDEPGTVVAKQDALRGLIDGAKVRSGRAWTPKMQAAVDSLTGGATAPSPTPAAAATTPKAAPALGAIQDGYRFKGGDPAKVSNWEKVGG